MRRSIVRTTTAALFLLALATSASAQEPGDTARKATVHLVPSIGRVGGSLLGWGTEGTLEALWIGNAQALGLAAEVRTPLRFLDLRAGVSYARPRLSIVDQDRAGFEAPTRTTITSLTASAVVRAPRVLDVQPYLLVGGGVKHYAFDQERLEASGDHPLARDRTVPVLQVGAGLAWDVGRYDLYLELNQEYGWLPDSRAFRHASTSDHSLRLGIRIPIR